MINTAAKSLTCPGSVSPYEGKFEKEVTERAKGKTPAGKKELLTCRDVYIQRECTERNESICLQVQMNPCRRGVDAPQGHILRKNYTSRMSVLRSLTRTSSHSGI